MSNKAKGLVSELERFRENWKKEIQVVQKQSAPGDEPLRKGTSTNQEEKLIKDHGFCDENTTTNMGLVDSVPEKLCFKSHLDCSSNSDTLAKCMKSCSSKDIELLNLPNPEAKQKTNTTKKPKLHNNVKVDNFLDLLIADIDEITVIPFFDLQLPREIGLKVFKFLNIKDLCHCALVSKSWKNLADDQLLWYNHAIILGFVSSYTLVSGKSDWKYFVQEGIIKQRQLDSRWRERICKVEELEYERGGMMCAVSLSDGLLCAGYSSGAILLWDIQGHYGSRYKVLNSESITQQEIYPTSTAVTDTFCAAGLNDGKVSVWHNGLSTSPLHHYQLEGPVKSIAIATASSQPIIVTASDFEMRIDVTDDNGQWFCLKQKHFEGSKIQDMKMLPRFKGTTKPCVVMTTRNTLHIQGTSPDDDILVMDHVIGGKMSCIDGNEDILAVGIGPYGYGVLENTIRVYHPDSGRLVSVLSGHYNEITCVNVQESPQGHIITGSYDKCIRIYDLRTEDVVLTLPGHNSYIKTVQMDDWKVVSGAHSGEVCVWDQRTSAVLWRTLARQPVRLCHFDGVRLITANIPSDRTNLWYADDLILHRKNRGSLRLFDFSSDNPSEGLPGICSSSYDDRSGYNYNIALVTPYDDIDD